MSEKPGMRKSKKLPVCVVEQHNDVLPFIHRAIGSRQLPFANIPFIHFDSHPDLLISTHLDADCVEKPQELYESVSIENWLLPLAYAKHVDHIVWIKPPWAYQIAPSSQDFTIGKCQESGKLRLNSKENYFLTDALFCPKGNLTNSSEVKLTVVELCPDNWSSLDPSYKQSAEGKSTLFHKYKEWAHHLLTVIKDQPYILDMDLDFFSTANPFRGMFNETEENIMKQLYKCPPLIEISDKELSTYTSLRQTQLHNLETFFASADALWSERTEALPESELQKSLSEISGASEEFLETFSAEEKCDMLRLCQSLLRTDRNVRDISFNQLHDFGCTLDDTELPHHISTEQQVHALEESLHEVMKGIPRPSIVTISRSSHDDYCPPEKVDSYQEMFLHMLERLYGDLDVTFNY